MYISEAGQAASAARQLAAWFDGVEAAEPDFPKGGNADYSNKLRSIADALDGGKTGSWFFGTTPTYPIAAAVAAFIRGFRVARIDYQRHRYSPLIEMADELERYLKNAASADTHPKDGDALAAPLVSGAVAKPDAR